MRKLVYWSGIILYVLLITFSLSLRKMNGVSHLIEIVPQTVSSVALAAAGFFILWRKPGNRIGQLFILIALSMVFWSFSDEYARHALLVRPGSLPFGQLLAWVSLWSWIIYVWPIVIFLPLVYPNGRLPSLRWRPVAWLGGVSMAAMFLAAAFKPGVMEDFAPHVNPLGLGGHAAVWEWLELLVTLLVIPTNLLATLSLILRFRRAGAEPRAQIKWFLYIAVLILLHAAYGISSEVGLAPPLPIDLSSLLFSFLVSAFALALAVAILKHRLYDIDLIIRRTLQYALLTGLLALIYFSSITLLQGVVVSVTGEHSPIAVVLSTLLSAALFAPLRQRIQAFIDRRFYRKKYDAQQVLTRFAQTAREEVSLEALTAELTCVVQETMLPRYTAIWLKNRKQ